MTTERKSRSGAVKKVKKAPAKRKAAKKVTRREALTGEGIEFLDDPAEEEGGQFMAFLKFAVYGWIFALFGKIGGCLSSGRKAVADNEFVQTNLQRGRTAANFTIVTTPRAIGVALLCSVGFAEYFVMGGWFILAGLVVTCVTFIGAQVQRLRQHRAALAVNTGDGS